MLKNLLANAETCSNARKRHGFNPWVRKIPWGRKPTPVFLPGESHGKRNLVGYSPWGHKESDMMKQLRTKQLLNYFDMYIY